MNASTTTESKTIWTSYKHVFILTGLFLVTLLIRLPALQDPLKGSHVWLTAHTAMTLQIWQKEGIARHHFSPVYTYNQPNNKHLRSLASGLADSEGNYYYVSYPPFSFILAFVFVQFLGLHPDLGSLQVLNLLLHFLTSWLIYIIICRIYSKNVRGEIFFPGLLGAALYLFATQALWCHGYMYFADTLIQPLWVFGLWLTIELLFRDKNKSALYLIALGITIFLAAYTEWLGFFFAGTLIVISLVFAFKDKSHLNITGVTILGASAALLLTLFQYAQINGLESFLEASVDKYLDRSGYQTKNSWYYVQLHIAFVLRHYWRLYFPILIALLGLFLAIFSHGSLRVNKPGKEKTTLLSLIVIPILIHHTLFLEFSKVHDFALLKTLVLFSFLLPFLYERNMSLAMESTRKTYKIFFNSIIVFLLALNLTIYYRYNNNLPDEVFREAGRHFQQIDPEEVIYVQNENDRDTPLMIFMGSVRSFSPQVQLMAGRNALGVQDTLSAKEHMIEHGIEKAHIVTIGSKGAILNSESLRVHSHVENK